MRGTKAARFGTALRHRMTDLPLATKMLVGLGVLIAGLLVIGTVIVYSGLTSRKLLNQEIARQRRLADLAAHINNTLLDIQNRAFEFHNAWTLHGFERELTQAGFGYARESYLYPLQEQIQLIRYDIDDIRRLDPDEETYATLDTILTTIDAYELTLLQLSDEMERLGYRTTGKMGQIGRTVEEIAVRLNENGLEDLDGVLTQSDRFAKAYFLNSDLGSARRAREAIHQLGREIDTLAVSRLSASVKSNLHDLLTQYDDQFLEAMSEQRKMEDTQPRLLGQSELVSLLVTQLFEKEQSDFDAALGQLQTRLSGALLTVLTIVVVALLGAPAIAYAVVRQVIRPIQRLGEAAAQLGAGNLDVRAPVLGRDEIGATANAFNMMAERLQELLTGLEQRVAGRTRELEDTGAQLAVRSAELEKAHAQQITVNTQLAQAVERSQRRAALLQASAEVSKTAAQIRDLETLLSQATHLISRHFGYYHVGIFLVDDGGRFAVLHAANSEGGARMLARRHKLAVGTTGIVGFVTAAGQPRIAVDVGVDAHYFDNPDLPETRSEMALPLRIGDRVIGALDVQSLEEAAFNQEDISVLTALADQISIAIENARLFRQSQDALEEARRAQRRYLSREWSEFTRTRPQLGYEYRLPGSFSLPRLPPLALEKVWRDGEILIADSNGQPGANTEPILDSSEKALLAVPIQIRGQTIGVLDLAETDDHHVWSDDEIALVQTVADQLGQALEEARLFEQTQASLSETQTLFQTSRSLAAAQKVDEIWRAVINAAHQRGADACALFLFDTQDSKTAQDLILITGWDRQHQQPRIRIGTRLPLNDFEPFASLKPNQAVVVGADAPDGEFEEPSPNPFHLNGSALLLFQPITARDRWFGILCVMRRSAQTFSKPDTDFYRALADQAALTLEGQRLLTEAQRRAEREQFIRAITDKVRATSDIETILQTTIEELSRTLGFPRAFIRLGTEADLLSGPPESESSSGPGSI
jgi:GAF domain-containing protein/HAMP domain-containing protein